MFPFSSVVFNTFWKARHFLNPVLGGEFYSMLAQQMTVNNIMSFFEINYCHQWISCHQVAHWKGFFQGLTYPLLMPLGRRPALTCSSTTWFFKRHVKEEAKDFVMVPSRFRACGWRAGKAALSLWLMVGNSEAEERERQDCATWIHNGAEVFRESKTCFNLIKESFFFFLLGSNPGTFNHKTPQEKMQFLSAGKRVNNSEVHFSQTNLLSMYNLWHPN